MASLNGVVQGPTPRLLPEHEFHASCRPGLVSGLKRKHFQPTLSAQIRDLENELGVKLFNRKKGSQHVTLTAVGEAFAAEARLTLFHAERAVREVRAAKELHNGPWTIGCSPLVDLRILSKIPRHFSETHPSADIRVASAHSSEQAVGLMRGKLQAGLVILPVREERFTSEGLFREALVLALPEHHPLTPKAEIEIMDLHDLPLAIMRGDIEPRFGDDLNRIFAVARVRPRILTSVQPERFGSARIM